LDNKNNITTLQQFSKEEQSQMSEQESSSYAAVDLGSNSFHMVISRYDHGGFSVIDRQKEVVRLAEGLDEDNNLSDEVAARALRCLEQFGQLLRALPSTHVRVVGTNTLRRLADSQSFLDKAERALGL